MLDGRTMIEQLSELERRSDPVAIELAGVWTSSYAVVRRTDSVYLGLLLIPVFALVLACALHTPSKKNASEACKCTKYPLCGWGLFSPLSLPIRRLFNL